VDATFREHALPARRLPDHFPLGRLPEDLRRKVGDTPDALVDLLACTIPEKMGRHTYVQRVLWKGGSYAQVDEVRCFEMPVVVPRWAVLSGEVFGRGPALKAVASAYSLNEAAKLILIAANVSIYGMWTVADDAVNPALVKFGPGAMIPVSRNDNTNPSFRELVPSTRVDLGEFVRDDLRGQIQKNLYRDALGSVEGPKMTATEVLERQSLVLQDMGAAFGRANGELLGPAVTRVVDILSRRGKLPPIRVDGELVSLEYSSPLARAQSMERVTALRALLADAQGAAQTDPAAAAAIDTQKYLRRIAALTGAEMDVLRDDEEVTAILNMTAQAQAQLASAREAAA